MANSTEATIEEGASAAAARLLADLPPLASLRPGASIDEARAWQVERQRRAALERVAAGLAVDVGLAHLPAEITAVLGDVGQQGQKPETRPLNHDGLREMREGAETAGPVGNGLSWQMRNALQLIHSRRPGGRQQEPPAIQLAAAPIAVSGVVVEARIPAPAGVRTYPSLNLAAVKAGKAPLYRVWLYARQLDPAGRGWVMVAELRQALQGALTWRRLRQILNEGNGAFWTFDTPERLRYLGTAALAALLGLERLSGRPVVLPAVALDASIGDFKAGLYATFHAGRAKEGRRPRPVSRRVITAVAGVSPSTQQRYDRRAGVKRRRNIALTGRHSQAAAQEQAWQHSGSFTFDDKKGQQGERGGRYLARPLPNTYEVKNINQAANGRQQKVNERLSLLVPSRESRAKEKRERLFYDDGAAAGKSYNLNPRRDVFFPQRVKAEVQLWHTLPGRRR